MARAVAIHSVNFSKSRVLQKDVLNYASLGENSNKFYIIELQEGSGDYSYCIYTEYGRMGKNPRQEGRFFRSQFEAMREYDKIVSSKQSKGYKKIEVDDGFSFSKPTQVTVKRKANQVELSKINDKVLRLIGRLYQNATNYLVQTIETPLGKLSSNQVAKGLEILNRIEELLDKGSKGYDLDRYSNEFYSVIPVTFGSRVDYQKFIINDYTKLNEKKDLLGVMSSVVQVQDSLEKTLEEKYKALNIKLKALSKRTKEFKRVEGLVNGTHSKHHHFHVNIQEIYQIEDMVGHDEFNPFGCETMELFHGSRNENILSIMQKGLLIKPASAVHTGSMFGAGIYFASDVTKSANYCWGFGSADRNEHYYMFLCEVATGKIKDFDTPQTHLRSAPWGYNSVRGVKGSHLLHDEYIVYKQNQVKLKYIVEFKRN